VLEGRSSRALTYASHQPGEGRRRPRNRRCSERFRRRWGGGEDAAALFPGLGSQKAPFTSQGHELRLKRVVPQKRVPPLHSAVCHDVEDVALRVEHVDGRHEHTATVNARVAVHHALALRIIPCQRHERQRLLQVLGEHLTRAWVRVWCEVACMHALSCARPCACTRAYSVSRVSLFIICVDLTVLDAGALVIGHGACCRRPRNVEYVSDPALF